MAGRNGRSADDAAAFAGDAAASLAMRELRALVARRGFWPGYAAALTVVAVAGPFGTSEILGLAQRVVYWSVVGTTTFAAGMFASVCVGVWLGRRGLRDGWATVAGGLAAGPVVTAVVWALNRFWLDAALGTRTVSTLAELAPFVAINTTVAVGVAVLYHVATPRDARPRDRADAAVPDASRALTDRLRPAVRGPVLRMAVRDHYVEVVTARGRDLVLMRLSDAAAAMGPAGLRVHRSHWLAADDVAGRVRRGGRWHLVTRDGTEVPVGRTYLDAVRAAGWLDG